MSREGHADPAISVVLPVHNRAATVTRAIHSVLAQNLGDFELIIVDDGSSDSTAKVISEVRDARIRLLRHDQNRGGNAARNRGIREARAPVVTFLDSDDEYLPHKLRFVDEFFRSHPEVDVLIDSFNLVYPPEAGGCVLPRINPAHLDSAGVEEAVFARNLYKATPALSFRREVVAKTGAFDETLVRRQDMDLILRMARSARCCSVPDILWVKHWTQGSISSKQETFMQALIEICERHPEYLSRPAFRRGLARDYARHFLRLAAGLRLGTIGQDIRRFIAFRGRREALALLVEGVADNLRRTLPGAKS